MKAFNNLCWMLLGVAVGAGSYYCYSECQSNGGVSQTMNKVKQKAGKKINDILEK